jgi:hypothetical protein
VRFVLDDLLAEVPAAQIEECRTFYCSRPAGRGPSTLEQLHDVRARNSAPAHVNPPAVEEIVEAEGARVAVRIPRGSGSSNKRRPASEHPDWRSAEARQGQHSL